MRKGQNEKQLVKTKLRVGDKVYVRTGSDRGTTGNILTISRKTNLAKVEKVKMQTKHVKARRGASPDQNVPGEIKKQEGWVALSNLAIYNAAKGGPDRISYKEVDGVKQRVFTSSGEKVDI